jgi:hypothetical protein
MHYCAEYADVIFVRENVDGKFHQCALEDLSEKKQMGWIQMWHDNNVVPVRKQREKEK